MSRSCFSTSAAIVAVCLFALLLLLGGCAGNRAVPVDGTARDDVLAKAEPIADNLFQAMNERDYPAFSRDFDPAMQNAITQERFNEMMATLDAKVGKFQSREVARVEKVGEYYAVVYLADFDQEADVSWRIVLTQSDPAKISGLWYDSPKLRTK